MVEQYENNYSTQLNGAINSSVTTLTVDAVPTNMTGRFRIRIDDEIIFVTAVSGSTFTGCVRGAEGTTAASHSDNAVVTHVLTADGLKALDTRPYLDSKIALHATYGDDFEESTLNARWTPQGAAFKVDSTAFAEGGTWMQTALVVTTAANIFQTGPTAENYEIITSQSQIGQQTIGPGIVSSTGTGVGIGFRSDEDAIVLYNLTSYAFASSGATFSLAPSDDYIVGSKVWLSLRKVLTSLDGTIFMYRYSRDGYTWSKAFWYNPSDFTDAKIGWGRYLGGVAGDQMGIDRFNVINILDSGNNLVITPTSGTPTYTASSSFSGFGPERAANGTSTDWAANTGNTDNPLYWQVAWSVGQTLNRVVFKERAGDAFGQAYIELFDGSTTTKVPVREHVAGSSNWHVVDFPTLTGITQMRVVSTVGGGANGGFTEVEAYLLS